MKKRIKLILLCGVTLLATCGCSTNKKLEEKIEILENKINVLEEKNTNNKLLTQKDLVGTWESSTGNTITINEDGTYIPNENTNSNRYYAYAITGNTLVICSNVGIKMTNCFDEITETRYKTLFELYQYIVVSDSKIILYPVINNYYDFITWTKK